MMSRVNYDQISNCDQISNYDQISFFKKTDAILDRFSAHFFFLSIHRMVFWNQNGQWTLLVNDLSTDSNLRYGQDLNSNLTYGQHTECICKAQDLYSKELYS